MSVLDQSSVNNQETSPLTVDDFGDALLGHVNRDIRVGRWFVNIV